MRILYVTTIGGTMVFFKELIRQLMQDGNTVDIATNEQGSMVPECYREWDCKVYQISCARSVMCRGNLRAVKELRELVLRNNYDIVHCHTPVAAACTRVACRRLRKNGLRVIYTAHGFHFFQGAPLKNWLLYYPVEKFLSRWTDCLITINREDYKRAKRKFHTKQIEYVRGVGIDLEKFDSGLIDVEEKRRTLGVLDDNIMLLSVGELSVRKNHEVVIRALKKLGNPKVRYFIVGQGKEKGYLTALIRDCGLENQITLLGYRTDIAELCQSADLFVFPSKQEGLPVALMEAIACKTPVICSKIRGNVELVRNRKSMFDAYSVDDVTGCLARTIGDKNRRELEKERRNENMENYKRLLSCNLEHVNTDMDRLYSNIRGR